MAFVFVRDMVRAVCLFFCARGFQAMGQACSALAKLVAAAAANDQARCRRPLEHEVLAAWVRVWAAVAAWACICRAVHSLVFARVCCNVSPVGRVSEPSTASAGAAATLAAAGATKPGGVGGRCRAGGSAEACRG